MSATNFTLAKFKSGVKDIARPYMFRIANGSGCLDDFFKGGDSTNAWIRTANKPSLTLNNVDVGFYGMTMKYAGTPTYGDFNCTIIVTALYESLNKLYESLNKVFKSTKKGGPDGGWKDPSGYLGELVLFPLNNQFLGIEEASYRLHNAWIQNIGELSWDHESKDTPLTCDATIMYSHFTRGGGAEASED